MDSPDQVILRIDLEDSENPEVYRVPQGENGDDFINRLREANGNDELIIYKLSTVNSIEDSNEIVVISEEQAQAEYEEFVENFARGTEIEKDHVSYSPADEEYDTGESLGRNSDQLFPNDAAINALINVVSAIGKLDEGKEAFDENRLMEMLMEDGDKSSNEEKPTRE